MTYYIVYTEKCVDLVSWRDSVINMQFSSQTYPRNAKHYKQLLKAWISWAVWNDVSCDGLDDLPSAQRYIWKDMAQKWAVQNFKIGSSKKL